MRKKFIIAAMCSALTLGMPLSTLAASPSSDTVTIRVCNWEEYIDEGDWDEEEVIDLDSGDIFGENSMIDDFEEWYYETYGIECNVEYSTFGTNEDLYNMLTLGDVYDVVCPSEYMFMKLIAEDWLEPLSDEFFDTSDEYNYYNSGVSPYLKKIFDESEINGQPWSKYAAGYMWGVTGLVYNPEEISEEEVSTWNILTNPKYSRRLTIKDNVRDSYFMAVAMVKHDLLTSEEFLNDPNYHENLEREMNDVSPETVQKVLDVLQEVRDNSYSFETDSGKADMITGKVLANYQWSGDAVYTLDQADEDDYLLNFAVPEEASNIYFDGWVMLKKGIAEDARKKHACEAFINYLSRPDNAVRNMYYIGYTSFIAGTEDDQRVFEYADWNFSAEDDEEETIDYDISYFFTEDEESEDYIITAPAEAASRQLYGQYPDEETIRRTSIMIYWDAATYEVINQMWINVRCFNIHKVPVWAWGLVVASIAAIILIVVKQKQAMNRY